MAIVYNIKNILACIGTLEPVLAADIQALAEARLVQLGESADTDACKWPSDRPGNCNMGAIRNVIILMVNISDLQQVEDCARIIAVLDDEESSTSSESTSSESSSTSSEIENDDCFRLNKIRTPQRHETGSSTSSIIMDPLDGNVDWEVVAFGGDLIIEIIDFTGGAGGVLAKEPSTGEIQYTPNPDGSEAGSLVYIHVRYTDNVTFCSVDIYLHLTITEETTD